MYASNFHYTYYKLRFPRCVVAKVLNCNIVINKFKFQ